MANKQYTYELRHHHRYGTDLVYFRSQRPFSQLPADMVVCHLLEIDYDPNDPVEWVDVTLANEPFDLDELIQNN